MSLVFSNTTSKNGILQRIERELSFPDGFITGNATRLLEWTNNVNSAHDDALDIIFPIGGTWQFDDSNHTDYPIIKTNLSSGQRSYPFTSDENGNLILDVYKVMVAGSDGVFREIEPVDQESPQGNTDTTSFFDERNTSGTPTRYNKTANGIFLDPIPNYSYSNGLKMFISREGSYFTTTDTTKKPGIAGLFHEYYVVNPAFKYASIKDLSVTANLYDRKTKLEERIASYYGFRERDVIKRLTPRMESNK